jgi:hypothetical protein
MTLHPLVAGFVGIWFAMVLVTGIPMMLRQPGSTGSDPDRYIPIGMLVFGWALTSGGFTFEASRSRRALAAILDAEGGAARTSQA